MEKAYRNIGFIFLIFIPLTFLGFYKTYFVAKGDFAGKSDIFTHLHALVASAWIVLLITQPLLIRFKQNALHRTFGKVSYFIFALLILSFFPQMVKEYNKGYFPLNATFDIILLLLFYVLAIYHKRNIPYHLRYMISIALIFVGPTVGRIFFFLLEAKEISAYQPAYLTVVSLLLALIFWDYKNKRKYQPYLVALAAFLVYTIALFTVNTNLNS